MILREAWNDSFFLVVNAPGERMSLSSPAICIRASSTMTASVSGHAVKEGEPLSTIGNFNRRPGWTTTHLHFEVLVPTRDGWVRVNPYMTLVAAYEHLVRRTRYRNRGACIGDNNRSTADCRQRQRSAQRLRRCPRNSEGDELHQTKKQSCTAHEG